jgi:hypothetical protein
MAVGPVLWPSEAWHSRGNKLLIHHSTSLFNHRKPGSLDNARAIIGGLSCDVIVQTKKGTYYM